MTHRFALGLMIAVSMIAGANQVAAQTIAVWPEAVIEGDSVTLADVARITEIEAAALTSLQSTAITAAPQPGGSTVVTIEQVRDALAQSGVNLAFATIKGASQCNVRRLQHVAATINEPEPNPADRNTKSSRALDRQTLRSAVIGYFADLLASENGRIDVVFGRVDRAILELAGPRFTFRIRQTSGRSLGLVGVDVDIFDEERLVRTESIALTVSLVRKVVVADRPINRGATVEPDDVKLVERSFEQRSYPGVTDLAAVVGQRAKRFIPRAQLVANTDLEPVPLVKRGQVVEVRSTSGAVAIVSAAKALDEGAYGDVIDLRYGAGRGRSMQGVVIGPGKVTVGRMPESVNESRIALSVGGR